LGEDVTMARSGFKLGWLRIDTVAAKLALALVAGSVLFALTKQQALLLVPADFIHSLFLWQPLTYTFIATDPFGVIFGALILWQIGGAMESTWGSRRLLLFSIGVSALAALLTVGLTVALSHWQSVSFAGAWVVATALWVAYGMSYGPARTNFWGMPVTGYTFALIGAGFVLLSGAFYGWVFVVPDLIGCILSVAYIKGASPRLLWLRFSSWRLHRQLRGRSRHLKLVTKDRNIGGGSDNYLH
jgi:membrane associated rhomboid family serine protease